MFIAFEGIDGSGKTSLSNRIAARLRKLDFQVCHAREGGQLTSPVAERIRALTRDANRLALGPRTELLLYAAREAQTVSEIILPARARGEWVITDRYLYSPLALAREVRALDDPALEQVLGFACQSLEPDLVILIDVDPAVAEARKHCQRIGGQTPRLGAPVCQAGAGLNARVRRGLLEFARRDPARWVVIDTTWGGLDDAEDEVLQQVLSRAGLAAAAPSASAPGPAPARLFRSEPPREELALRAALLDAADGLAGREPPLAAWLLGGLSGSEIDERRLRLMRLAPAMVAWGLREVAGDQAMALRHALKAIQPRQVATSLAGLDDEQSHHLRLELAESAPAEVATSLERLADPPSMALRGVLEGPAPTEVLLGLGGLDSAEAWELRDRLAPRSPPEALAISLTGLDSPRAWDWREELLGRAPLAVVESLLGIGGERAHRIRDRFLPSATRAVLESLVGLDDEVAWRLREAVGTRMREAVESTRGLDSERAWALRAQQTEAWPGGCVRSLEGLGHGPRGAALLFSLIEAFPGDLELLRCAVWILDPARTANRAGRQTELEVQTG